MLSYANGAELDAADTHLAAADLVMAGLIRRFGPVNGEWTASVFLIFTLHRPDVLARGDLVIRTAAMRAFGLGSIPDPATLTRMGEPWRPYRTRACLYLWRSVQALPAPATPERSA
jgi:hypothetical protein